MTGGGMIAIDREEIAARLGGFDDWNLTREEVIYMMAEFSAAHWEDCGEELGGFALAMHGLDIAQIADRSAVFDADETEACAAMLHHIGFIAGLLISDVSDPGQAAALVAIEEVTQPWQNIAGSPYPNLLPIDLAALLAAEPDSVSV